jgi:hypothetical protein
LVGVHFCVAEDYCGAHVVYMDIKKILLILILIQFITISACSYNDSSGGLGPKYPITEEDLLKQKNRAMIQSPNIMDLATGNAEPPDPNEMKLLLKQETKRWFYGRGLGRTAANIGTIVFFPPYAIYLLGNAGMELAGYDPLYITNILPQEPREVVNSIYDDVTSVPGRVNAAIAGYEFDTPGEKILNKE